MDDPSEDRGGVEGPVGVANGPSSSDSESSILTSVLPSGMSVFAGVSEDED